MFNNSWYSFPQRFEKLIRIPIISMNLLRYRMAMVKSNFFVFESFIGVSLYDPGPLYINNTICRDIRINIPLKKFNLKFNFVNSLSWIQQSIWKIESWLIGFLSIPQNENLDFNHVLYPVFFQWLWYIHFFI